MFQIPLPSFLTFIRMFIQCEIMCRVHSLFTISISIVDRLPLVHSRFTIVLLVRVWNSSVWFNGGDLKAVFVCKCIEFKGRMKNIGFVCGDCGGITGVAIMISGILLSHRSSLQSVSIYIWISSSDTRIRLHLIVSLTVVFVHLVAVSIYFLSHFSLIYVSFCSVISVGETLLLTQAIFFPFLSSYVYKKQFLSCINLA